MDEAFDVGPDNLSKDSADYTNAADFDCEQSISFAAEASTGASHRDPEAQPAYGPRIQGISSTYEGVDTVAAAPALDNQPYSDVATSAPVGATEHVQQLTLSLSKERVAELFPDGAWVPAAVPKLPPVANEPTNWLCSLAAEAAKGGPLVHGSVLGCVPPPHRQ